MEKQSKKPLVIKVFRNREHEWIHKLPSNASCEVKTFSEKWDYLEQLCHKRYGCSIHDKYRELPIPLRPRKTTDDMSFKEIEL